MLTVAAAAAQAQSAPPVPPTPPAQVRPAPMPRPVHPTPPVAVDVDRILRHSESLRAQALDLARIAPQVSINADHLRAQALDMALQVPVQAPTPRALTSVGWTEHERLLMRQTVACSNLPGPRFPYDSADSLYQSARNLLNSGDYRAAAIRFKELQQKHPNSRCMSPGMYWQAVALYRIGSDADLREALTVLDAHAAKFPNVAISTEVASQAMRVRSQLAQRGDASAQREVARAAGGSNAACDQEELSVRSEALSALMRLEPDAAMPKLRSILEQRDRCIELRRTALRILGGRLDEQSIGALTSTARTDTSANLRSKAVGYLAQYSNDAAVTTLEAIARNDQNEQVKRSAARSLVGHPSARARTAARSLIEDNAYSETVRYDMLNRYTPERSTPEDATWLRAALPKVTSPRVKQGIVGAIGRIGGTESQQWLMDLSTNDQEPSQVRQEAFRLVSRSMTVAQLATAYDNSGSRQTRMQIVRALDARPEPAAAEKMLDIVRRGTDPEIRTLSINLLMAKKDARLTAALLALIDR
jgi:HEAT repeat protein